MNREIRTATINDLKQVTEVESRCFPAAEAATESDYRERLEIYPNHFWLVFEGDRLVSFVDGMVTDEPHLKDEMYKNAKLHNEKGDWQMIFGVNTIPEYRRQGIAGEIIMRVIEDSKRQNRKGIVLTCKEKLIPYYSKLGFVNEGISESSWGGEVWYEMRLTFRK